MARPHKLIEPVDLAKPFHGDDAVRFPPLMSLDQLAAMVGRSKKTIYHWAALGRLDKVLRKRGKHCYVWRDRFLDLFMNGDEW